MKLPQRLNTTTILFALRPGAAWFAIVLLILAMNAQAADYTIKEDYQTTVFQSGTEGYHTFRIPTIVKAANGYLVAIVEGRKNSTSDAGDIDLVMKRSDDGGRTWSPLQLIQDEYENSTGNITIGNPTPVVDMTDPRHVGRIWLPFTRNNDRVFVTYSDDHGTTWSTRVEITSAVKDPAWGWYATGPVHGIQLERGEHAGRLIIPSDHRIGSSSTGSWGSHIVYSDDHGQTWKIGASATHKNTEPLRPNENVAVELVDGRIYVNARDQHGSDPATRAVAYSSDGGASFDTPFAAEPNLVSPVVQNSAVRFAAVDRGDAANVLLYCGPKDPKNVRQNMTLRLSFDEGKTWANDTTIYAGSSAYSDLVKLDGTHAGVLFEADNYGKIVFKSVAIVPEPSAAAMLIVPSLGMSLLVWKKCVRMH